MRYPSELLRFIFAWFPSPLFGSTSESLSACGIIGESGLNKCLSSAKGASFRWDISWWCCSVVCVSWEAVQQAAGAWEGLKKERGRRYIFICIQQIALLVVCTKNHCSRNIMGTWRWIHGHFTGPDFACTQVNRNCLIWMEKTQMGIFSAWCKASLHQWKLLLKGFWSGLLCIEIILCLFEIKPSFLSRQVNLYKAGIRFSCSTCQQSPAFIPSTRTQRLLTPTLTQDT